MPTPERSIKLTPHPMNSSQKNTATRQDMGYMKCKKTKNLVHGFAH